VRVRELLGEAGTALRLRLVSGARGLERVIALPRLQQPGLALAGYLPQLHPDRVQVLGNSEVSYLATLEPRRARETVAVVATAGVACFVVTNDAAPPAVLTEAAEAAGVAVLGSALRTADFIRSATAWLEDRMAPETNLHGDLVEMHGLGILILGKSGIGKSEAALDLVARGHRLVADDVVQVRRPSPTGVRGPSARAAGTARSTSPSASTPRSPAASAGAPESPSERERRRRLENHHRKWKPSARALEQRAAGAARALVWGARRKPRGCRSAARA